jgi:predicted NAD-dependent protein-ADP-ribosyltransferase YbiA (DUF1768 family)
LRGAPGRGYPVVLEAQSTSLQLTISGFIEPRIDEFKMGAKMRIEPRKGNLTIQMDSESGRLREWLAAHGGQVFRLRPNKLGALVFHSLGPEADACRQPINITSRSPMPLRLISNFAHTPFVLDGVTYASVEGFWQGLKFADEIERRRLADLFGSAAKDAGFYAPTASCIHYEGRSIRIGTFEHWQLMQNACQAKFEQNSAARDALLSTLNRPLIHQVARDSKTIPGVIMADIWMQIRSKLCAGSQRVASPSPA